MRILPEILLITAGFSLGFFIASGLVALVIGLGIVTRYAGITKTAGSLRFYECCCMAGALFGDLFSLGTFSFSLPSWTAGVFWQDIAINGAGVFPLVLCCVKRQIGLAVQLVERYPIGRKIRDADRPRNLIGPILSRISGPEFPAQLFRFGHCVLDLGDIAQEDDKFVPADPPDDIALAEYAPDFFGDLGEDCVAENMTKGIVDRLEIVEVDHQEGVERVLFSGLQELPDEPFGRVTVVQPGQQIPFGAVLQRQLVLFLIVDVGDIGKALEFPRHGLF